MIPTYDFAVNNIFKTPFLETVFSGLKPRHPDDLLLRDKFFPLKAVTDADLVTLHSNGYGGKTPAVAKSATDMPTFNLASRFVKDYQFGYWGEMIRFDKEVIQKANVAVRPEFTTQALVNDALMTMSFHNDMLFEWTAGQVLWTGSYAINANGVVYTYADGVPAHYRLDMTDTVAFTAKYWTPVLWSSPTTCAPLTDIRNMIQYTADLGQTIVEMIMHSKVAKLIEDSTQVQTFIKASPLMAQYAIISEYVIKEFLKLKNILVTIDDRVHNEYATVMADASSSATVLTVDDISNCTANKYVLVREGINEARCKVSSTSSSGLLKYVTLSATPGFALHAGKAQIEIPVAYAPDNMILFRTTKAECSSWIILPDNVRAEDPMEAKIHVWSIFHNEKPPYYYREMGNYFKGGIINRESGNYLTLKVQA